MLLEGFVRLAGSSLSTVTSLFLLWDNTSRSPATAAAVNAALELLVAACPRLTSLEWDGQLSWGVLRKLGQTCKDLSTLTLGRDIPGQVCSMDVESVVAALPTQLPQVSSLSLPADSYTSLDVCTTTSYVEVTPNMSANDSLLSLRLGCYRWGRASTWLRLPYNLQHFSCRRMECSFPPEPLMDGHNPLASLLSVDMGERERPTELGVLASILRCAPLLQQLNCSLQRFDCPLTASGAEDLHLVASKIDQGLFTHILRLCFDCGSFVSHPSLHSYLDAFPPMQHVQECHMDDVTALALHSLLHIFPSMQRLCLHDSEDLDDAGLQELAVCSSLKELSFLDCNGISPTGVMALCRILPSLKDIYFLNCVEI